MNDQATGHQRIDRRSLALHRAIADKLRADPSLIQVARDNIDRWSLMNSRSQPYWDAWRELLSGPVELLLPLLVEESERMAALRQATPLAGILSPQERWAIYGSGPFTPTMGPRAVAESRSGSGTRRPW